MESSRPSVIRALLILTTACALGFLGSEGALQGLGGWYPEVTKPNWALPVWVWVPSILLACGVAGTAVVISGGNGKVTGTRYVWLALALVAAWAWFLFAWHQFAWASVSLVVAWLALLFAGLASARRNWRATVAVGFALAWTAYSIAFTAAVWHDSRAASPVSVQVNMPKGR